MIKHIAIVCNMWVPAQTGLRIWSCTGSTVPGREHDVIPARCDHVSMLLKPHQQCSSTDHCHSLQARHIRVLPDNAEQAACVPASTSSVSTETGPLSQDAQRLIQASDCIFIATHLRLEDNKGKDESTVGADVSHRGGPPGFVHITTDGRLQWADYIGNYFFQTLGQPLTAEQQA